MHGVVVVYSIDVCWGRAGLGPGRVFGVSAVEKSTLDGVINKNFLLLFFGGWKSKAMVIEDLVGPIVFKKFLL